MFPIQTGLDDAVGVIKLCINKNIGLSVVSMGLNLA